MGNRKFAHSIGQNVTLGGGCEIHNNSIVRANCNLGSNVIIGYSVAIDQTTQTIVNAGCTIGNHVTIYKGAVLEAGVIIQDNVTIKSGATISAGVTVLSGSIVPENETVTTDSYIVETGGAVATRKLHEHTSGEGANFTIDLVAEGNADGLIDRDVLVIKNSDKTEISPYKKFAENSITIDLGDSDFDVDVWYKIYR